MATTIKMPQLGESVTEGTIERWLVKEGDTVEQYDPLFEVVTDKVNAEVPASVLAGAEEMYVDCLRRCEKFDSRNGTEKP